MDDLTKAAIRLAASVEVVDGIRTDPSRPADRSQSADLARELLVSEALRDYRAALAAATPN